jgi:hypothetical protein
MACRKETTIERIYRKVTGKQNARCCETRSSAQAKGQAALVLARGGTENAKRRVD